MGCVCLLFLIFHSSTYISSDVRWCNRLSYPNKKNNCNVVVAKSEQKGLNLNSDKSFSVVFSKSITTHTCHIDIHGNILEQVQSFIYLGSLFSSYARWEKEIIKRIGIAKSSFTSMNTVLTSRNIDMAVRIRVLKGYVWSTLLYGYEACTLSSVMTKKTGRF